MTDEEKAAFLRYLACAALKDAGGICRERYLPNPKAEALRWLAQWLVERAKKLESAS